jgi:hypothetical protein
MNGCCYPLFQKNISKTVAAVMERDFQGVSPSFLLNVTPLMVLINSQLDTLATS